MCHYVLQKWSSDIFLWIFCFYFEVRDLSSKLVKVFLNYRVQIAATSRSSKLAYLEVFYECPLKYRTCINYIIKPIPNLWNTCKYIHNNILKIIEILCKNKIKHIHSSFQLPLFANSHKRNLIKSLATGKYLQLKVLEFVLISPFYFTEGIKIWNHHIPNKGYW